jgi:hypothetical protein
MTNDRIEIVKFRSPIQDGPDKPRVGYNCSNVARASSATRHLEIDS